MDTKVENQDLGSRQPHSREVKIRREKVRNREISVSTVGKLTFTSLEKTVQHMASNA